MARFPETFIQQVLQSVDVVDLVGQYVALKRKGREFVGLCPFHEDSNPSMYVSPTKQIYKCFACGAGGNALQFVMNVEKLSFPEAVRTLADRQAIPLPKDTAQAPQTEGGVSKNDLAAVCEFAMTYFAAQLRQPAGKAALDYVHGRGMTDESIEAFGLGYAPDRWDSLIKAAAQKGIGEGQLVSAGLVRRRDSGGCYDYFRNRLMFPIHDTAGRVAGFGGRALSAEERAKYLNSPESALFDKSSMLYGLQFAREGIVRSRQAVVVEGYFDVLMPIQQGVGNVVATLGTALTDRHVRTLSRFAEEAVLVFDADVAGAAAAERALEIFLAQKLHVRVATIPAGKDPCDYALAEGDEALQRLIDQAPDALQYVWDQRYAAWQEAGGNPSQRQRLIEDFLQLIVNSASYGAIDGVRQQTLAQHIAHVLNASAIDLQQRMKALKRRITRRSGGGQSPVASARQAAFGPGAAAEREVLETLLDRPDLFDDVVERLDPDDFNDAMLRTLADRMWQLGHDGRLSIEELLGAEDLASLSGTLADMAMAGERRGNHEATIEAAVITLVSRRQRREVEQLKQQDLDDDENLRRLQERLSKGDVRKRPKIE
ncbi:MAG: DNA primase [Planctomycetes bacterium]|jgi:DNA primase|nr:DNA primase [Planctomycetota bacterium]